VLSLSPLKIMVVLLVALVLVGPDKLPSLARQIGGAWKAFRSISSKLEDEVRSTMPDLPSTGDIARFARSPVALLDSLAKLEDTPLEPDPGATPVDNGDHLVPDPGAPEPGAPRDEDAGAAPLEGLIIPPPAEPNAHDEASPMRNPGTTAGGFDPSLN
jgi:TatA/E family protein of Tat protein translocase